MDTISQQNIIHQPVALHSQTTDRDTKGHFVHGNKSAVGRSSSSRNNLQIIRRTISAEDVAALADILKTKAMSGDLAAIKILLDLCLPPASSRLAVDDRQEREEEERQRREAILNPTRGL